MFRAQKAKVTKLLATVSSEWLPAVAAHAILRYMLLLSLQVEALPIQVMPLLPSTQWTNP